MNYRRVEMEKKLPEASQYLCDFLKANLREAGIGAGDQDILFIGKLVSEYMLKTAPGKRTALKFLSASIKPASALKTYYRAGFFGDEAQRIPAAHLQEFRGWLYKDSLSVAFDKVEIEDKEDATVCESCGGRFPVDYCAIKLEMPKPNGTTRVEFICNHCRYHSDNPKVRDTGDQKTCAGCEKKICEFHPEHLNAPIGRSVMALPPPRQHTTPVNVALPPGWERP